MIEARTDNLNNSAAPAISVVVPCRNEAAHIERCLTTLLEQETPPGGFEVIVADGMSEDGTREILKGMCERNARLLVVDNAKRTTPCGMNCGIRASRGQWVAIVGSHNRYARDYLLRCLETAMATGADNVGGAMYAEAAGWTQQAIAAAHHSPFSVGGARWHNPEYEGPADTVFGGFYRREVFNRIGLFDEELVRNQDDELNLRLTRAGGRIWQSPKVKSWYHPRASLGALFRQYQQYGYWKVRVIQKHKLPASWRHLVPGGFVLGVLALALCSAGSLLAYALGMCSATVFIVAVLAFALSLGGYFVTALIASTLSARAHGWSLLPVLPFVFACYHIGYGWGFLRGTWDFFVRSRRIPQKFVELTRAG